MEQLTSILIIEDDPAISSVLKNSLEMEGFSVECVNDGALGLETAQRNSYALIILDLNLPKISGLTICKMIRKDNPGIPMIMLTSRDSEMDKVIGLEAGADDYVTKPFGIYELLARVRARLRDAGNRSKSSEEKPTSFVCGPLALDTATRSTKIDGKEVELTRKEFNFLAYLMENSERVVSKAELLEHIWGSTGESYESAVRMLVTRLRKKLRAEAPELSFFRLVRGVGFQMSRPHELSSVNDDDEIA